MSLSSLLRRPHRILKIFSTMKATQTHINTTNSSNIIKFFRKQNHMYSTIPSIPSHDLIGLFNFLRGDFGWETSTYDVFISVLHHFKSVETFVSDLQSIGFLNNDSKTNLLSLLADAGKFNMLIDAYHHMVESHGYVPNTFALNLLMDSLFTTSQPLVALSVLEQMNSPDSFTFELLLFHISNLKDKTSLLLTSSYFLKRKLRVPYDFDKVVFNTAVISFCKTNNDEIDLMPQVYQLLGLKVKSGLTFYSNGWTSIILKCCEFGRPQDAAQLFFDMIQTRCSLDVVPVTHTVLFKALLESNKVDDALHLVNAMIDNRFMPDIDSFEDIITAICAQGRMDEAVDAYVNLVIRYSHSDSLVGSLAPLTIMIELIKAGKTDEAARILGLSRIPGTVQMLEQRTLRFGFNSSHQEFLEGRTL